MAHHWGVKAAGAGLPEASNPYLAPNDRHAWLRGYRSILRDEKINADRLAIEVMP
jgi:ribosome modulation factor